MSKTSLTHNTDIVCKIRRAEHPEIIARKLGIVLNDDGSVFDRAAKKLFTSIVEWSRETSR